MIIREDELRNFSFYHPDLIDDVMEFRVFYYTKVFLQMRNGEVYVYDEELNSLARMPDDPYDMTEEECRDVFRKALAHIMRMKGVSQDRLSRLTGISQQAISSYICGRRSPTLYVMDKLAKALECSTDDFRYIGF